MTPVVTVNEEHVEEVRQQFLVTLLEQAQRVLAVLDPVAHERVCFLRLGRHLLEE